MMIYSSDVWCPSLFKLLCHLSCGSYTDIDTAPKYAVIVEEKLVSLADVGIFHTRDPNLVIFLSADRLVPMEIWHKFLPIAFWKK